MHQATFRFYANLNDFLGRRQAQRAVQYKFRGSPGIKDAIEAIGPPHPEIELILVNGRSSSFDYALQDGDFVSIYPRFSLLEIESISKVVPAAPDPNRFVLDAHLGRLTNYLRMLGFDCLYHNEYDDKKLARLSSKERRVLLTRDRGLLKRSEVVYGYCVRADQPRRQLVEVLARFKLSAAIAPFTRCMCCNQVLVEVAAFEIRGRVPEHIFQSQDHFKGCKSCGRVYWRGSHHARMQMLIDTALDELGVRSGPPFIDLPGPR